MTFFMILAGCVMFCAIFGLFRPKAERIALYIERLMMTAEKSFDQGKLDVTALAMQKMTDAMSDLSTAGWEEEQLFNFLGKRALARFVTDEQYRERLAEAVSSQMVEQFSDRYFKEHIIPEAANAIFKQWIEEFYEALKLPPVSGLAQQVGFASLAIADLAHQVAGRKEEIKDSSGPDCLASAMVALQAIHAIFRYGAHTNYETEQKSFCIESFPGNLLRLKPGSTLSDSTVGMLFRIGTFYEILSKPPYLDLLAELDRAIGQFFREPNADGGQNILAIVECRRAIRQTAETLLEADQL